MFWQIKSYEQDVHYMFVLLVIISAPQLQFWIIIFSFLFFFSSQIEHFETCFTDEKDRKKN